MLVFEISWVYLLNECDEPLNYELSLSNYPVLSYIRAWFIVRYFYDS